MAKEDGDGEQQEGEESPPSRLFFHTMDRVSLSMNSSSFLQTVDRVSMSLASDVVGCHSCIPINTTTNDDDDDEITKTSNTNTNAAVDVDVDVGAIHDPEQEQE